MAELAAGAAVEPASTAHRPPNIVLVMADDLGYGELGCYGQKAIRTPNIDRLATEGVRFTDFYAGSPVCAPSRCVLMTGKHSGHAAIRDNGGPRRDADYRRLKNRYGWEFPGQNPLPEQEVTIGEALRDAGYATAAIGKWGLGHFGTSGDPQSQGFDLFYGFNCQWHAHNHYPKFLWRNAEKEPLPGNDRTLNGETYSQDKFTEVALDFVRRHADEPFFLYLPFAIPHLSIQAPPSSVAEYRDQIPEADYKHRGYLEHPTPRAGYAAMITHMDRDIGKIVEQIEALGLAEDTLIIFTSDNGPTYNRLGGSDSDFFDSAAGMRGLKGSVYEGGIRVPMIARWAGRGPEGVTSDLPCAAWDLMATACDAAGVATPSHTDGLSLLPTITGNGNQREHDYLLWDFPGYGGQQAVRMGRWKGVRTRLARGRTGIELYDLQSDPGEAADVADEHPDVVAKIAQVLASGRTDSVRFPIKAAARPKGK
ncbi:MAG: arylsulfatase [Planctomycetota bacterium]